MAVGKKYGGRKKGVPNKLNQVNRQFISDLLSNQGDSIELALKDLYNQNKQAYLDIIYKLVNMIIPRLKEQDIEDDEEEKRPYIFKLKGTDKITFNGK